MNNTLIGTPVPPRATNGRATISVWLWASIIGIAALLPRCTGLSDFFTIDEAYHWIQRVHAFSNALEVGDWRATLLTGHPGVLTTWLGSLGRQFALAAGIPDEKSVYGATTSYLAELRLPLAIVNGIAVIPGYLLLRRLIAPPAALLGGFFWALSPFLIGFSRLLHVDGLTTSFTTLSILLLLVAVTPGAAANRRGAWLALVGSGACAGFALLSKSSALILLPWAAILVAVYALRQEQTVARRGRRFVTHYAAWFGATAVIFWACWPAMWVAPLRCIQAVLNEVIENGGQPHAFGNYFLDHPVADPGALFYPAVMLWRSTPITLIGLLIGLFACFLVIVRKRDHIAVFDSAGRGWTIGGLLLFVVLFAGALGVAAKKFDRYLLPAWPAIEIIAAWGLVMAWQWSAQTFSLLTNNRQAWRSVGWCASALVCLSTLVSNAHYTPYYMAYYNPLLGGGAVAQHVLLVGWGEGMEQIGAWLETRPDVEQGSVLSWLPPTLTPFLPHGLPVVEVGDQPITSLDPAPNYAVVYARGAARNETPALVALAEQTPPLYTLTLFGITYATIHQLPKPFSIARPLSFDNQQLALRGYTLDRTTTTLTTTLSWDVRGDQTGGSFVFLHILNEAGARVGQVDAPIDNGLFTSWQRGQQFSNTLPITLSPQLAPGTYRVVFGTYHPNTANRRSLDAAAFDPAVDGPNAALLTTFTVSPSSTP